MPRRVPKRERRLRDARSAARSREPAIRIDDLLASPEVRPLLELDPDPPDGDDEDDDGPVEPGLMVTALARLVREAQERETADYLVVAARTYTEYHGYDANDPMPPEEAPRLAELARRLAAVGDVLPELDLPPDPDTLPCVALAACEAVLLEVAGRPAFDRGDFAAGVERARALLRELLG